MHNAHPFLSTTALSEFWKTDQPVVYLGRWCLSHENKSIWDRLNYRIVNYPYNNSKTAHESYLYCNEFYERILKQLAEVFNIMHGVKHSLRYWRIILGP